ncbi:toll/interleukin-1 receptor domain-containing protein [Agrobacterium tumefaciens]
MNKRYDVGLSFAGEDRMYVSEVAKYLEERCISVFYDDYEKHDLWGKDLYEHLSKVYKDECRYVLIFISKNYATKLWTTHERRNAQARAFMESSEYILPARFDDTEIPGILPTTGYIRLDGLHPRELVKLVEKKIGDRGDFWSQQAHDAAKFSRRVLMEAHRGAFKWTDNVTALFANSGKDDRIQAYVEDVLNELDRSKILGRGTTEDGYTWTILYDGGDTNELTNLLWEKYLARNPGSEMYCSIQLAMAKASLRNHLYIAAKESNRA